MTSSPQADTVMLASVCLSMKIVEGEKTKEKYWCKNRCGTINAGQMRRSFIASFQVATTDPFFSDPIVKSMHGTGR